MHAFVLKIEDCNIDHFHFLDSKSNLIMEGVFTKLIYALPTFTINSIYINFPIKHNVSVKNCIVFDPVHDRNLFTVYRKLESDLLQNYAETHCINKKPNYSMSNMFSYGKCKFFNAESVVSFLVKVSGIWESETEYGVTYKIVDAQKVT